MKKPKTLGQRWFNDQMQVRKVKEMVKDGNCLSRVMSREFIHLRLLLRTA